ncbi:MAG: anhydro-N-acetylmuramic acid kinase [Bacteroidetes bacterium]|nr:MAG: anhydro-N-acetylmuramic acid kinase [Bacteroidota bacterium]
MANRLSMAAKASAKELFTLDAALGHFFAQSVKSHLRNEGIGNLDLIASHGHTVFHDPNIGSSLQIGKPNALASVAQCPVIYDFRSSDLSYGGQGAPILPFSEEVLFPAHDGYLNLGGIANLNMPKLGLAFDIAPCNQVLNHLAQRGGHEYDRNGELSKGGQVDEGLLKQLRALSYLALEPPKSLDNSYSKEVLQHLEKYSLDALNDTLFTYIHFLAMEIARWIEFGNLQRIMVTGGGAYNTTLFNSICQASQCEVIKPDNLVVEGKEALCIAWMGLSRYLETVNAKAKYTGARKDTINGAIILP